MRTSSKTSMITGQPSKFLYHTLRLDSNRRRVNFYARLYVREEITEKEYSLDVGKFSLLRANLHRTHPPEPQSNISSSTILAHPIHHPTVLRLLRPATIAPFRQRRPTPINLPLQPSTQQAYPLLCPPFTPHRPPRKL